MPGLHQSAKTKYPWTHVGTGQIYTCLGEQELVLCKAGDVTGVSENHGAPERVMVMELIM